MYMSKTIARYLGARRSLREPDTTLTIVEDEPFILYNECFLPADEPLIVRAEGDDDDDAMPMRPDMPETQKPIIRAIISTATPDRANDIVMQDGFQTQHYMQNPVVLWGHDHWMPPIAQTLLLGIDGQGRTWADALFMTHDVCPLSWGIYQKILGRFLRTVSVGFRPITWAYDEDRDGYNFLTQELLEFSVCTIPMNPEALIQVQHWQHAERRWYQHVLEAQADTHSLKRWEVGRHQRMLRALLGERALVPVTAEVSAYDTPSWAIPEDVSVLTVTDSLYSRKQRLDDFSSEPWDLMTDSEKQRIAGHFAWSASGEIPRGFGDLYLLHHGPDDGAVIPDWLLLAMRDLPHTAIPQEAWPAIQAHLARHCRAFGMVPLWERDPAIWDRYCTMVDILKVEQDPALLAKAQATCAVMYAEHFSRDEYQALAAPRTAAPAEEREDFLVFAED